MPRVPPNYVTFTLAGCVMIGKRRAGVWGWDDSHEEHWFRSDAGNLELRHRLQRVIKAEILKAFEAGEIVIKPRKAA